MRIFPGDNARLCRKNSTMHRNKRKRARSDDTRAIDVMSEISSRLAIFSSKAGFCEYRLNRPCNNSSHTSFRDSEIPRTDRAGKTGALAPFTEIDRRGRRHFSYDFGI